MLRIQNIKVALGKTDYKKIVSQTLNIREKSIKNIKLVKQSIDARRDNVHFICSFDFEADDEDVLLKKYPNLTVSKVYEYKVPQKTNDRVVVVGSGPAGLFCAYVLSLAGNKVTVVERGGSIEQRVQDVETLMKKGQLNTKSNIAFGEGGAGTFSDGKLTTGVKNEKLHFVLNTFVNHGAPEDILYLAKPHIGTDYLRNVIVNMRKFMEEKGVEFLFNSQFVGFEYDNSSYSVSVQSENETLNIECDRLVLAIGHSARDTYEYLYHKGLNMEQKPFAVGVRIEQLQETINKIQYKKNFNSPYLKAAPYKLAVQTKEKRGVYTFCMCPGGVVVPSMHEDNSLCVNGMSYYARDGINANSAVLVTVNTSDFNSSHPLAGIEFQRELESKAFVLAGSNYCAPVQLVDDYKNNVASTELRGIKPSYPIGYKLVDMNLLFPDFINRNLKEGLDLMNKKMPGFIDENTIITGVEARSSAPVRITRNDNFESNYCHLYPIGEGAGYAGGIMSAALDGILCAEKILLGK